MLVHIPVCDSFKSLVAAKTSHNEKNQNFILVPILTRQCYPGGLRPGGLSPGGLCPGGLSPGGLCPGGLLTRRWGQIFNHLYKVKGEDASNGADLPASPLVSNVCLQLDHIPLGERQLITVLPLEVKPRHTSWATLGEARTLQTSGHFTWT